MTKLDIFDELDVIKICTGYRYHQQVLYVPPNDPQIFAACEPIYEEMPGWRAPTHGITDEAKLPAAARSYIAKIEQLTGIPIVILSTGPEREQIIIRKDIFKPKFGSCHRSEET